MRRSLPATLLALIVVLTFAAPAAAQSVRDPFDPLLSTSTTGTSTEDPTTTNPIDPVIDEAPLVDPAPSTDDLPNTGSYPKNWLAIAYVLLAMGTALLAIGRLDRRGGRTLDLRSRISRSHVQSSSTSA
ncbi:MAG TPA: hypothetical protein VEV82_01185 [Actinomycetota bacterium]|nr:hypothetical protein [Actinomycetota bacterium]